MQNRKYCIFLPKFVIMGSDFNIEFFLFPCYRMEQSHWKITSPFAGGSKDGTETQNRILGSFFSHHCEGKQPGTCFSRKWGLCALLAEVCPFLQGRGYQAVCVLLDAQSYPPPCRDGGGFPIEGSAAISHVVYPVFQPEIRSSGTSVSRTLQGYCL